MFSVCRLSPGVRVAFALAAAVSQPGTDYLYSIGKSSRSTTIREEYGGGHLVAEQNQGAFQHSIFPQPTYFFGYKRRQAIISKRLFNSMIPNIDFIPCRGRY